MMSKQRTIMAVNLNGVTACTVYLVLVKTLQKCRECTINILKKYDFWHQSEKQNGLWRPFCKKMLKTLVASITVSHSGRTLLFFDFQNGRQRFWKKVVYWSEMARNAIVSDFRSWIQNGSNRTFKMAAIWNGEKCDQNWFSVIQNSRRQPFCEQKIKVVYWSEMARNAIESYLSFYVF